MDNKTWRIVKIIDNYCVVVNAGAEHGIKVDDELEVYEPGEPIIDPETNEELGTLDKIKSYLRVKHVYQKMCLCVNADEKITTYMEEFINPFTKIVKRSYKPLPVDAEEISGGWKEPEKIKVGDFVRKSLG